MNLTKGWVQNCIQGKSEESPIVQVCEIAKKTDSFWVLTISDSINLIFSFVTVDSATGTRIAQGEIQKFSIMKLSGYTLSKSQKLACIVQISEFDVIEKIFPTLIGEPLPADTPSHNQTNLPAPRPAQQQQQLQQNNKFTPLRRTSTPNNNNKVSVKVDVHGEDGEGAMVKPISHLNPFQQRWTIKARCTYKGQIRTFMKEQQEGKVTNVEFIDESGTIRATMFGSEVDEFYPLLQVGNVYYISKAKIKQNNGEFASPNPFEMYFNKDTLIVPCPDIECTNVPRETYKCSKIDQVQNMNENDPLDMIAIVREITDLKEITSKQDKKLKKRDIVIGDETGSITLSLWNEIAEAWTITDVPFLIGIKNARVKSFIGKCLGPGDGFRYEINPQSQQAQQLSSWYEKQEGDVFSTLPFLSKSKPETSVMTSLGNTPIMSIAEGLELGKGKNGKAEFFAARATITLFKHDSSVNLFYTACPAESCGKKVIQNDNGLYDCQKCQKSYPQCLVKYILNLILADSTSSLWATVFDEAAFTIIGKSAAEIKELREKGFEAELEAIFDGVLHIEAIFKIKVTEELYQDEMKVRSAVLGAYELNFVAESSKITQKISSLLPKF